MDQAPKSPRTKLRDKLKKHQTKRAPGNGPHREKRKRPTQLPTPGSTQNRTQLFAEWVARQMVRSWKEVCHNSHPFMLLFNFDMSKDPLTLDPTAMVGSRLDVMLIKVNGGIYYESSTHMDGLQKRLGGQLSISPPQLLYVHDPGTHVKDATVDLSSDISKLEYVATSIPASWAREQRDWDVPIVMSKHLPTIRPVEELPPTSTEELPK